MHADCSNVGRSYLRQIAAGLGIQNLSTTLYPNVKVKLNALRILTVTAATILMLLFQLYDKIRRSEQKHRVSDHVWLLLGIYNTNAIQTQQIPKTNLDQN